jgi:hypothetical protein
MENGMQFNQKICPPLSSIPFFIEQATFFLPL